MSHRFSFLFHLFLVLVAWLGPFLFSWYLMMVAYAIVVLQFVVFEKCLLNQSHGLMETEDKDATFYSELLTAVGIKHNRKRLKKAVRTWLYPALAAWALIWQLVLKYSPVMF